jgi:hypothetical protein
MSIANFETTRLPKHACPYCGYEMDAATHAGGDSEEDRTGPAPGDLAVCLKCMEVSKYTDDMALRKVTDEELAALEPEVKSDLARARAALGITKARYPEEHAKIGTKKP